MSAIRRITALLAVFGLGVAAGLMPSVLGAEPQPAEEPIYFETARASGFDPFTPPAVLEVSGPYGGTGEDRCDPEMLIAFLLDNPERLEAWAEVQGVEPAEVPDFIRSLRPVILTEDTAVTNHGFRDGRAYGFRSILQAGTAVLVDEDGKPVVRCRCGNPLKKPECPECERPKCPETPGTTTHVPDECKEDECPDQPTYTTHAIDDECDEPTDECPEESSVVTHLPEECREPEPECPDGASVTARTPPHCEEDDPPVRRRPRPDPDPDDGDDPTEPEVDPDPAEPEDPPRSPDPTPDPDGPTMTWDNGPPNTP